MNIRFIDTSIMTNLLDMPGKNQHKEKVAEDWKSALKETLIMPVATIIETGNHMECECTERYATEINSYALFQQIRAFFESQVEQQIYVDIPVKTPYYIGFSEVKTLKWYATKWYKCNICGCLWEFNYPDFPAQGFVRKFEDGKYFNK